MHHGHQRRILSEMKRFRKTEKKHLNEPCSRQCRQRQTDTTVPLLKPVQGSVEKKTQTKLNNSIQSAFLEIHVLSGQIALTFDP